MFSKFSVKREVLFLDSNTSGYDVTNQVDIILSPELYWVKKVSIPVKTANKAKPLLASLFEGTLPLKEYSYSVYKKDDSFYIFAYEDKEILSLLESRGINASQVHNVYFAQSEFQGIKQAIKINETLSMYIKDDVLVLVPSLWVESSQDLDLENFSLSKHSVILKKYTQILTQKHIYTIATILIFLIMITMTEYFIVNQKISEVEQKRVDLFENTALKPTLMQSRAIFSEYTSLHTKQKKLREYIGFVIALKLQRDEKISSLHLDKNKLVISLVGVSQSRLKVVESTFKKKNIAYKVKQTKSVIKVEISL